MTPMQCKCQSTCFILKTSLLLHLRQIIHKQEVALSETSICTLTYYTYTRLNYSLNWSQQFKETKWRHRPELTYFNGLVFILFLFFQMTKGMPCNVEFQIPRKIFCLPATVPRGTSISPLYQGDHYYHQLKTPTIKDT